MTRLDGQTGRIACLGHGFVMAVSDVNNPIQKIAIGGLSGTDAQGIGDSHKFFGANTKTFNRRHDVELHPAGNLTTQFAEIVGGSDKPVMRTERAF